MKEFSILVSMLFLQACASISPDSIIAKHSEKRQNELQGPVAINFEKALKLIPECLPYVGKSDQVHTAYGTMQTNPILSARIFDLNGEKQLALGNNISGGTNLFVFSPQGENTLVTGYWKRWNKSFEQGIHNYYDVLVGKEGAVCEFKE